jgi:hypothetical protein
MLSDGACLSRLWCADLWHKAHRLQRHRSAQGRREAPDWGKPSPPYSVDPEIAPVHDLASVPNST